MKGYVTIKVTEGVKDKILETWKEVVKWRDKPKEEQVRIGTKYWLKFIPVITYIEEVLIPNNLRWYFHSYCYDSGHYGAYVDDCGRHLQYLYNLVYISNEITIDGQLAKFYRNFARGDYDKYGDSV